MAQSQYQSFPRGEEVLFQDNDRQLDLARNALARVKHTASSHAEDAEHLKAALGHFLDAQDAQPRQDVVAEILQNATYLASQPQHRLIMADYYLAVAEYTQPQQRIPSLETAMGAVHKAVRAQQNPERIAEIALNVLGLCPATHDGHLIIGEASGFINRHVNILLRHDQQHGTATARAFLDEQMAKQAPLRNRNGLPLANLQGHYRHVIASAARVLAVANDDRPQHRLH